jgi:uncharacterized protein (TIGR01732 family)
MKIRFSIVLVIRPINHMTIDIGYIKPNGGVRMGNKFGGGFSLLVVLFILLIIIGCVC